MRAVTQATWSLLAFGFLVVMLGILWFVNMNTPREIAKAEATQQQTSDSSQSSSHEASLWSQLIPKTTIQKRDEARSLRQEELSAMIGKLHGIASASVVLSDQGRQAIGQPHRTMTACVTVEPTDEAIPRVAVQAICSLIAGATLGLEADDVTVINSQSGVICTSDQLDQVQPFDVAVARQEIEDALGLTVATVLVKMKPIPNEELVIPRRNVLQPHVRVTVPRSWVKRRSEQVGDKAIVLSWIQTIVEEVVPGARFEVVVIQDTATVLTTTATAESYAKQIALVVGLLTILLSGLLVDRHRRFQETVVAVQALLPKQEAIKILEMEHHVAKQTIDALVGARRIEVLRAIVSLGDTCDIPVVQVPLQRQLELTRCG